MLIAALSYARRFRPLVYTKVLDPYPYLNQVSKLEVIERDYTYEPSLGWDCFYLRFKGTEEEGNPLAETHTCIGRDVVVFADKGKISAMEVF